MKHTWYNGTLRTPLLSSPAPNRLMVSSLSYCCLSAGRSRIRVHLGEQRVPVEAVVQRAHKPDVPTHTHMHVPKYDVFGKQQASYQHESNTCNPNSANHTRTAVAYTRIEQRETPGRKERTDGGGPKRGSNGTTG